MHGERAVVADPVSIRPMQISPSMTSTTPIALSASQSTRGGAVLAAPYGSVTPVLWLMSISHVIPS